MKSRRSRPYLKSFFSADENSFGMRMLTKMGWNKDKGLGAKEDGSKDFIRIRYKNSSTGMGFEDKDSQWTEHEDKFSQLLESLKGGEGGESSRNLESLEEKSKNSKARVHYKKFTKGKDLSQYSEKDLANIFGRKTLKVEEKEKEESEEDHPSTSSFGVQTVLSKISSAEYFMKKMNSTESPSQGDPEEVGKISKKKRKKEVEEAEQVPEEKEETPNKEKKLKKKRKKQVEEVESLSSCQETVEDNTQIEAESQEIGAVQETSLKKKNRKKPKGQLQEAPEESQGAEALHKEGEEVKEVDIPPSPPKKIKKQKVLKETLPDAAGEHEPEEVSDLPIEISSEVLAEGPKLKKKRRKNKDEAPESIHKFPEEDSQKSSRKEKLNEEAAELFIDITSDASEDVKPRKKKKKNRKEAPKGSHKTPEAELEESCNKNKLEDEAAEAVCKIPTEILSDALSEEPKCKKKRKKNKEQAPGSLQEFPEDIVQENLMDKMNEEATKKVSEIPIKISSETTLEGPKIKKKRKKNKEEVPASIQKSPEIGLQESSKDKFKQERAQEVSDLAIELSSESDIEEPKPKKRKNIKAEAQESLQKVPEDVLQESKEHSGKSKKKSKKLKESKGNAEDLAPDLQEALKAYSSSGEVTYYLPLQRCDALLNLNANALKGSNFSSIIGYRLNEKINIRLVEPCEEDKDASSQEAKDPKSVL